MPAVKERFIIETDRDQTVDSVDTLLRVVRDAL